MRSTSRSIDLPLGPGRETLRVTVTTIEDGRPDALVLAAGWGGADTGDPFHRPPWARDPLTLPASVLPALKAALDAIEAEP